MDNFTPIKTEKKKKKSNKLLIIGNLLLVLIMALGGYFYYNNVLLTKEQKAEGTRPPGIPTDYTNCSAAGDGFTLDPNGTGVTEGCPGGGYLIENICTKGSGENIQRKWYTTSWANCGPSTYTGVFGCPTGTNISCGPYTDAGAMLDVGGPDTSGIGTCNTYAPILWAGPGGNCQINCLCCPTGTKYNCTTSSNTYEYATVSNRKYICKDNNHADKYISSRPNPAYNPSLPPEDQTGVCFEDGLNNQGQPKWKCLSMLTTCAIGVCSCGTVTIAVASPTPTTPPSVTDTPIPTATPIPPTATPPIITNTPTMTPTGTIAPSNTPTMTPTGTLVPTNTPTNTPTSTPVLTNTPGPSATPTEIILAKVSPSPTSTTQLLKTGMIQSFLYWIPAAIMLVGLIL